MKAYSEISALINTTKGVVPEFRKKLEVSLDCPGCKRIRRTVTFDWNAKNAECFSSSFYRHPFDGEPLSMNVDRETEGYHVRYSIHHQTAQFFDPKHKNPSVLHPTWARISFDILCPECGSLSSFSTQNNINRPFKRTCPCGRVLYFEKAENPRFRTVDENGRILFESSVSRIVILIKATELPSKVMTAVSILSGKSEEELEQCIQKGIPIFSQDKFDIKENPATFSQNLRRAVSELIMHDIDFEVRDTGRSIKEGYMYRMEQSD